VCVCGVCVWGGDDAVGGTGSGAMAEEQQPGGMTWRVFELTRGTLYHPRTTTVQSEAYRMSCTATFSLPNSMCIADQSSSLCVLPVLLILLPPPPPHTLRCCAAVVC
jgi:hypothetical protein